MAYKLKSLKESRKVNIGNVPCNEFECDHLWKPFGYYLNGGNDPSGEHLALDGSPSCDSIEDIDAGCTVDAFADPKTNFFDIVEQVGFDKANKSTDAINAGEKEEK